MSAELSLVCIPSGSPGVDRPDADDVWDEPATVLKRLVAERTEQRDYLVSAGLTSSEVDRIIAYVGASPDTPAPSRSGAVSR